MILFLLIKYKSKNMSKSKKEPKLTTKIFRPLTFDINNVEVGTPI